MAIPVNISLKGDDLTIHPFKAKIGGLSGDLTIIWTLAPGAGGWQFETTPPGIVCEKTPPPPYAPWDGADAKPGPGPNQYTVTAVKATKPKTYKYSIHLVSASGRIDIDPEIMNDP
jgi:hypothetical protein